MKRIDELRPMIMKISLIISLFSVLLLMNFTMKAPIFSDLGLLSETEEVTEVIRTPRDKKKAEKPPVMKKVEFDNKYEAVEFVDSTFAEIDTMAIVIDTTMDIKMAPSYTSGPKKPSRPIAPPPDEDIPIRFPDKWPAFGDCRLDDIAESRACSDEALLKYVAEHIRYPSLARENRITGRVTLQFVVGKDGVIRNCELIRDIGGGCGAEAVRVIESMPRWSPGAQKGRLVSVMFTLPVHFKLK